MFKLAAKRCVVLGGGKVASRRTASLLAAQASVVVVSPRMDDELLAMQQPAAQLALVRRPYKPSDLTGAALVVIATDDAQVNRSAAAHAKTCGALVNLADDPDASDVTFMAQAHHGPITLAVHTSGISAAASAAIRLELSNALSPHWQTMLETAGPWREKIQQAITDPKDRRARLLAMTDARAIALFLEQGETALQQYYERLADPSASVTDAATRPKERA